MLKTVPVAKPPVRSVDDAEDEKYLPFTKQLGAEFVRLTLGDGSGTSRGEALAALGPGDGENRVRADGDLDGRQDVNVDPVIQDLGQKLRNFGDEIDSEELKKRVVDMVRSFLQKVPVYQITQFEFNRLCDGVVHTIQSTVHAEMDRVFAVYTVLSELVERLRSGQSNETREATFRTFTGRYVIDSGLIPFLMQLGGFTALGDPVLSDDV